MKVSNRNSKVLSRVLTPTKRTLKAISKIRTTTTAPIIIKQEPNKKKILTRPITKSQEADKIRGANSTNRISISIEINKTMILSRNIVKYYSHLNSKIIDIILETTNKFLKG